MCTSLLHLLCHYMAFHYFPSSVTETLKVAGGFLLGLPHTTTYAGQQFFSTGPMWYLLSLLIGWVLLDAILNIFPEKYTHWAVLGIMLLGWGTTLVWELPFSLSQGAVIVPYLYIGYLAKKNRWLDKPLPRRTLYILLGGTALTAVGALLAQSTDCISMGEWSLGPLSILLDAATGFLFIRLFMRLNRFAGPIAQGLQAIGRNSLNIFCIHTVELIAIPWYLFAAHFTDHPLRGMLLQNVIAFTSIGLVCALLNLRRSWIVKASAARRQAQGAPPRFHSIDFPGCCGAAVSYKTRGESGYEQRCPPDPGRGRQPRGRTGTAAPAVGRRRFPAGTAMPGAGAAGAEI